MTELLDHNIKDIVHEYPALEAVLAEFSIGCTSCSLGSCRLKDIVEIHNLSPESEQRLMRRIAEIVYPGIAIAIPILSRTPETKAGEAGLCPPLRQLVNEHSLIKRFLRLVPAMIERIDTEKDEQLALECANFAREYADEFHHAKEENILFGYFDETSEIINSFCKEHDMGRSHVRNA